VTVAATLARAGLIVSGAFLISRVLGWLRLVVVVNAVADPRELDAFFAAFRIPDLLFQLVAAGAVSSALIPVIANVIASDGHDRAWRVVSTVTNLMLGLLLILALFVFIFADRLVPLYTAGFDPVMMARTIELTRIMVLSPIFLALGAIATSVLNSEGRFAAAAVAPIVYNLAIIGAALLLTPTLGAVGLAIGVVAGSLGHVLVQLPPLQRLGFRYTPRVDVSDADARRALGLMVPRAIGLGASQITFVVTTALATTVGVGAVTSFTIAFTLLQIPIGVIGVPLGVVLFPSLSRGAAAGDHEAFVGLLNRAMRLLAVAMIPVAALAGILRVETVALLFGDFEADAIRVTADTFLAFLLGAPAHALIAVLARAFYARQDTVTPVVAAIGAVAVNTTLAAALVGPFGLPGMAFAIAVAAWLEAAALLVLLRRREGRLGLAIVGSVAARTLVATGLASLVGGVTRLLLEPALLPDPAASGPGGLVGLVTIIVIVSSVYGAMFIVFALALRIAELRSIVAIMVDALRRPRPA
jgi:putative peptidoglycan lipid II flippase